MSEYSWQSLYTAALAETDQKKLNARIEAARRLIHERMEEIKDGGSAREQQQLDSALHSLFTLAARKRSA
jgi:hypothetical protein